MMERRGSLEYFSEIIRQSRQIYDVTDFFADGTNNILQLAYAITRDVFLQEETAPSQLSPHRAQNGISSIGLIDQQDFNAGVAGGGDVNCRPLLPTFKALRVRNWTDAFLRYPRAYLRISTCIDCSLATGRLPRDESLPPLVRDAASFLFRMPSLPWTLTLNATLDNSSMMTYTKDSRNIRGKPYHRAKCSTKPTADVINKNNSVMDDPWYLTLLQNKNEQLSGFAGGIITNESANTMTDECINMQPGTW
ncbi:hypothetical protein EIK77_003569 [Talaromyces pinophilus]|nr:hypothetical protein EIK77_003569 [Talaromyces pinophilus]